MIFQLARFIIVALLCLGFLAMWYTGLEMRDARLICRSLFMIVLAIGFTYATSGRGFWRKK